MEMAALLPEDILNKCKQQIAWTNQKTERQYWANAQYSRRECLKVKNLVSNKLDFPTGTTRYINEILCP